MHKTKKFPSDLIRKKKSKEPSQTGMGCVMWAVPLAHSLPHRCWVNIDGWKKKNQWTPQKKKILQSAEATQENTCPHSVGVLNDPARCFPIFVLQPNALHCSFLDSTNRWASQPGHTAHLLQLVECLPVPGNSDPDCAIFHCCGP